MSTCRAREGYHIATHVAGKAAVANYLHCKSTQAGHVAHAALSGSCSTPLSASAAGMNAASQEPWQGSLTPSVYETTWNQANVEAPARYVSQARKMRSRNTGAWVAWQLTVGASSLPDAPTALRYAKATSSGAWSPCYFRCVANGLASSGCVPAQASRQAAPGCPRTPRAGVRCSHCTLRALPCVEATAAAETHGSLQAQTNVI